jgi:hypothetical protein
MQSILNVAAVGVVVTSGRRSANFPHLAGRREQEVVVLSEQEQADLLDLTRRWEGAYSFKITDAVWQAIAAGDPAGVLTAESAWELREKVRADYAARKSAAQSTHGYRNSACPRDARRANAD